MTSLPVLERGAIVPLRLPEPARLFAARAERLAALAPGHAAGPFLELLARIARGQHAAAREVRSPAGSRLALGAGRPLDPARRDPSWHAALGVVLGVARDGPLPGPAADAIRRLDAARAPELEAVADGVLALAPGDPAAAPFVLAALEVSFARLAAGLDPKVVPPAETGCPVCGSAPVAGLVLGDDRLRYLACGLCASRWHLTRVQCATCRATGGISYFDVEGAPAGARAEACDVCRTYVKLFDAEELPGAEPVADDAATIVLDLLMAERGFRRAGRNPLAPGGERA
jgi:FdhE protein